ncbi:MULTISPECIES: GNAT family N-acetyltransferase [Aestuariivivens]|uniref:GNAT family N-acetyltransferase n=1 Tax=Aestuariivivens TaxID=1820275 RepID=UPI001CC046C6|nr:MULTISPECIES: GNAT family N-acetyltransferase [Aestuariivivens]
MKDIRMLWNNEYPTGLNHKTLKGFEDYLTKLSGQSHILVINENKEIIGWYFDFIRNREKWFVILLDSKHQGKGLGTKILSMVKKKEIELNGWVIDHNDDRKKNGEVYKSPLKFYLKNGFERLADDRLILDNISAVKIRWNAIKT